MSINEIIRRLAEYYHLKPHANGKYNLDDYDWFAGCSMSVGNKWLTLQNVVEALVEDDEWNDYWSDWENTDWSEE